MAGKFLLFHLYTAIGVLLIQIFPAMNSDFIDLKFDLKLRHIPHECRKLMMASSSAANATPPTCTLPYTMALLEPSQKFDLQVISYESGISYDSNKKGNHFYDDTVIGVSNHLKHAKISHEFVGIKFYGLPKLVQNYFIFDVSKLIRGKEHKVTAAVHSNDLSFKATAKQGKVVRGREDPHNHLQLCTCQNYTCACCAHAHIPKISLNANCCMSLEYLWKDYGISFTISLNGHVIYNETVSARNPPPVCFEAPYLKDFASLCFHFYNMSLADHALSGCLKMEGRLYDVLVGDLKLGCFHFGPLLKKHRHSQKYGTMTIF